jgi:hypothetical protein
VDFAGQQMGNHAPRRVLANVLADEFVLPDMLNGTEYDVIVR